MTRATRTAPLLIAFYLLTSATMADAECAWVLWLKQLAVETQRDPQHAASTEPLGGYARQADCEAAARTLYASGRLETKIEDGIKLSAKLICLPDTVDPRGPKAK